MNRTRMAPAARLGLLLGSLALLSLLSQAQAVRAETLIIELPSQTNAREAVQAFEATALSLRNATDTAFQAINTALAHAEDAENATNAVQDAISDFYFTVTSVSLNATNALPIPEDLTEEVASLLYQARHCLLQSLQDRLALAAALVSGTETVEDAQELTRLYALQTGSHDFYLTLLLKEAQDAATP